MAAGSEHNLFQNLLQSLLRDEILEHLDIKEFAIKLLHFGRISKTENEKIQNMSSNTERRMELFGQILLLKTPEKVIESLRQISAKDDISRLAILISTEWDEKVSTSAEVKSGEKFDEAIQCLKCFYMNECEVMREHWNKLMDYPEEFEMDDMYVELDVNSMGKRDHKPTNNYQDLFGMDVSGNRRHRKIILEGDPGMGKTTYVHRLVQLWSKDKNKWLKEQFDLMVAVRLGNVKPGQGLLDHLQIAGEYKDVLIEYVSDPVNHGRILLVLDAFDEMPPNCNLFLNLIENQTLHLSSDTSSALPERNLKKPIPVKNITILISTRISHSRNPVLQNKDSLIRTCGFNIETVKQKFQDKIKNFEALAVENFNQVNLYRNPLFVGMACSLGCIPGELSDLMANFCRTAIERYWQRSNNELIPSFADQACKQILKFLGKISFFQLVERRIILLKPNVNLSFPNHNFFVQMSFLEDEIDIHPESIALCWDVGLLCPNKDMTDKSNSFQNYVQSGLSRIRNSSFPHQLFSEYLAAYYAATSPNLFKYLESSPKNLFSRPFSYFLSGISDQWQQSLLERSYERQAFFAPWIYQPETANIVGNFRGKTTLISKLYSQRVPNFNNLIDSIVSKRRDIFRNLTYISHVYLDELTVETLLQSTASTNIEFDKCTLAQEGTESFQNWFKCHPLKLVTFHGFLDRRIGDVLSENVQQKTDLEEIVFRDHENIFTTLETLRRIVEQINKRKDNQKCKLVFQGSHHHCHRHVSDAARKNCFANKDCGLFADIIGEQGLTSTAADYLQDLCTCTPEYRPIECFQSSTNRIYVGLCNLKIVWPQTFPCEIEIHKHFMGYTSALLERFSEIDALQRTRHNLDEIEGLNKVISEDQWYLRSNISSLTLNTCQLSYSIIRGIITWLSKCSGTRPTTRTRIYMKLCEKLLQPHDREHYSDECSSSSSMTDMESSSEEGTHAVSEEEDEVHEGEEDEDEDEDEDEVDEDVAEDELEQIDQEAQEECIGTSPEVEISQEIYKLINSDQVVMLDISGCTSLGNCAEFFTHLNSDIETLNVSNCSLSTEAVASLSEFLRGSTKLKHLLFSGNENVSTNPEFMEAIKLLNKKEPDQAHSRSSESFGLH